VAGDATRITVAQMARVYLAPVGTVAPDGPVVVLDVAWKDVGLFTPDSLEWATDPGFEQVNSHQSNYPTRRFQTTDAATVQVDFQEWSAPNFKAVYGGGDVVLVTPTGAGPPPPYFKFSPPAIGGRDNVAAIIEVVDGNKHYRRIVPKCMQTEGVTQQFHKTSESTLPLRLSILGSDVGDPWYDVTDDPAFDPLAA
jgi:hypothetical protein